MMKRIIALLLALILTVGLLPTVALAAEGDQGTTTPAETSALAPADKYYKFNGVTAANKDAADITLSKTAVDNKDGTYTVTLEATAKQLVQPKQTEVVFVLDASGSMAFCAREDGHTHTEKCYRGRKLVCGKHSHGVDGFNNPYCEYIEEHKSEKSRWEIATGAIQTMVSNLSQKLGSSSVKFKYVYFKSTPLLLGGNDITAEECDANFQVTGLFGKKDVDPYGGTPLVAGVKKGISLFSDDPDTVKALIIVSDGEANVGTENNSYYPKTSATNFKTKGTIYTVGFMFKNDDFDSLASDGCKFNANNTNELTTAMGTIEAKIIGMIDDPLGAQVDLVSNSLKLVKGAASSTQPDPTTKDDGRTITWTDKSGMTHVKLTYTVKLKDGVTKTVGKNIVDLNGNATFNYSYKKGNTTVSKSLSFPKPQATVYVASLDVKYRLESETGTEVNVAATSEISGTSHEVKQLPYTFAAKLPAEGDTVIVNGATYYVKSVTGDKDKANAQLNATEVNAKAHTITVVLTETAPTASYKVEHYKQNVDGTFPATADETEENLTGSTGTTATATPKTYTGFTCDESVDGTIKSGTIAANGSLVLKLYYTRNSYTVTFKDGANEAVFKDETQQVEYGKAIPSHADPVRPGYNFTGWTSEPANYQPGTGTMPANNITFTAQWTEKGSVTINYVAKTGGTVTPPSETLNPDTGVAKGSTAKANDGYRFVGWYSDKTCTTAVPAAWVDSDNKLTPGKPEGGWADATYYAKFESLTYTITFETETGGTLTGRTNYTGLAYNADFPDEPEKSANSGYYFDGWYKDGAKVPSLPPKVTENATYTAKWLPYSSIGLDLTGKIQKTLNSDVALSNERFTINLTLEGAEAASATATATVSAIASGTGYTGTAPFQTASDEFKLTFTAPDTYKYYIAEEDGLRAGMTYDVKKPANGHQLVVVVQENASNHALFFESVTIDGTEVNPSDENDTTPWLTITNNYVEPKETFDLNTLITKKFEAAADSKTIPTGTYEFKAQIVETDSGWNKIDSGATYEGTATLTAGGTADFAFGNDRYLKLAAGDHYYLVSEISDTVSGTTGTISYDNLTYSLKITVGPNGKVTDVEVKNFAVVSSFAAENAVEFKEEDHITFNNTYFEEKDPNECTIDFSKFVKKELTTTGSKTVDEATFIVDVAGSYDGEAIANALPPTEMQATTDEDVLNTTLTASIKNIVGGNVYEEPFTGSVTVSKPGHYTFTLTEHKGTQSGVTYDEAHYQVFVNIMRVGDNLVIHDATTYLNNEQVELIKLVNDVPVTAGYIVFKNTIDTGRDDYIPIIIPTIINKDTGMLNKTDHFAYVIGYPDGTVHPNGQITRAEVATIFFRLLRDEVRDGAFTTSNSYSDVAYGKWYNNPISTMSALGIITGYPDGTFKPNKPITRAEFAAIAARFDETQSGKSATFSDVIGHWAAKEIGIAYYNDWIKGYPDGTFKPDQNITRAEAMTLINRVLERKPESPADLLTNMNKWTDNLDTSKWYYLDVQEATNSHGYTRKTFNYELWRQMLPDPDWSRYER